MRGEHLGRRHLIFAEPRLRVDVLRERLMLAGHHFQRLNKQLVEACIRLLVQLLVLLEQCFLRAAHWVAQVGLLRFQMLLS